MSELIVRQEELGVDITQAYLTACYSPAPPYFDVLHEEYQISLMELQINNIEEDLEKFLDMSARGEYDAKMIDWSPCPEMELFDSLLRRGFSFLYGCNLYNPPVAKVW